MMSNSSYKYSFSKGVFFIFVLYVLTQITAYAASINVTQAPEGDLIVSPPFTWSTSYINDGETNLGNGYNWLSKQQDMSNTFEFVYDGNLDGSTGEEGDSNDIYHLDSISLYVPNSDRALKEFTLFSQSNNGPWKQLFSSQALPTPYNFARTSAGGIRTVNPPSSSWSPDYINDGNTSLRDGYNWLSKQQDMSNTFEFTFDPDLDGSAGETNEQFTLDSISVYVPSSDRALREFTLFSQSNNGPWQQLFSSQALPSSYNFAKTSAGGVRAVNPPSSSWSPDYINDGNTSLRDGYNWLSKQRDMSNIFEFTFDPDLDGSTGEANEQFTLDSISVYVPNSDRALKDFEITVQTTSGWQPAIALQAAKQLGDQTFSIGPINNVLRVRLTTSSNYGDVYQQINEFEINGVWSGDNPIFVTSQLTGEQRFDLSSNPTNNDGRRESITRLKLETSSNHGGSYQQINEFEINGIWSGDNPIFVASQLTGEQRFDLSSNPTNNDGRRESITRLKLETSSNHGGSYQQINEFQAFGSFGGIVPIASWHMDEDSWNSITDEVIDATDNNYHGTAINGTTTEMLDSAITGNPGSCGYAQFDGSNDYIDLPDLPNLTSSFTLTAWVKSTSSKRGRIFADDDNNQGGYALSLNEPRSGRLRFYSRSINPVSLDTRSVVLPPNKHWYFVTTVHDANTKQRFIYVNGTLEASGTYTGTWGTDTGHASIGSETNASKEGVGFAAFEGNIDEVQVFESALTQSQIQVIMAETHPCEVITDASNFNCVATNTNAITGRLYTQIENHPFTLDVAALQDSTTLAAGFSNTVTVELVNASSASDCASYQALDPALEQSLSFTSITGIQTTASISSEKAYRNLKCRVTDTTSSSLVVGCSADSFAIRPQGFTLSSPLNSTSHTGSQTKKAGITFDITAKTDTLNYDGSPVFNSAKITAHNNAVQTGTLSGDFPAADFTTGNATGSNFTYNEVGIINLDSYAVIDNDFTAIDKAAGDCVSGGSNTADASGKFGCTIGNEASLTIGRFIPDHFEVSTVSAGSFGASAYACSNFNYIGQNFSYATQPEIKITAYNALSPKSITQNYSGDYAKLSLGDIDFTPPTTDANQLGVDNSHLVSLTWSAYSPLLTDNNNGSLNLKFGSDSFKYLQQTNTLVAPFTNAVKFEFTDITDNDSVASSNLPLAVTPSGALMRFGRLNIDNAHGAETVPLTVPVRSEYFNGINWTLNSMDSCTDLNLADNIILSNPASGNNKPGNTAMAILSGTSTASWVNTPFSSGVGNLTFRAPGEDNRGHININGSLTGFDWLKFDWNSDGSFTEAPSGRASFGIFNGSSKLIFRREVY